MFTKTIAVTLASFLREPDNLILIKSEFNEMQCLSRYLRENGRVKRKLTDGCVRTERFFAVVERRRVERVHAGRTSVSASPRLWNVTYKITVISDHCPSKHKHAVCLLPLHYHHHHHHHHSTTTPPLPPPSPLPPLSHFVFSVFSRAKRPPTPA